MAEVIEVVKTSDEYSEVDVGGGVLRSSASQRWYVKANGVISIPEAMASTVAGNDGPLPAANAAYSSARPNTRVRERRGEKLSSNQIEVRVEYADPDLISFENPTNLLALPAIVHESEEVIMEEYTIDRDSPPKYVVTSAGEPFEKFPERLEGITVYNIEKYVTAETRQTIRNAKRTLNASPKTIDGHTHDTLTLLMCGTGFSRVTTQPTEQTPGGGTTGGVVYLAKFTVKHKPGGYGWNDAILMYGYDELVNGERRPITTLMNVRRDPAAEPLYERVPVSRPWPLSLSGAKKPFADDDPDLRVFFPYGENAWNGVPLA